MLDLWRDLRVFVFHLTDGFMNNYVITHRINKTFMSVTTRNNNHYGDDDDNDDYDDIILIIIMNSLI